MSDELDELAYLDSLGMWEAAVGAAVGYLTTMNTSTQIVRHIAGNNTNPVIRLAAQTVLHARGKPWRVPPTCGSTNSETPQGKN